MVDIIHPLPPNHPYRVQDFMCHYLLHLQYGNVVKFYGFQK